MRYFAFPLLLVLTGAMSAQNTNVTFRSKVTYPNQELANVWGYAAGGHEYALVGAHAGLSIVEVTNPDNPVVITQIPGAISDWHEIQTYSHYAYVVSEGGMGLQIIDLTNLPGSNLTYHSYMGNGAINGLMTKAHSLHIDVTKGYAYVYGNNSLFSGKPVVLNLNPDPYNPTYVNYVDFIGYAHDGYVENDRLYTAHIYAGVFTVVDMTNKNNPVLLATQSTPNAFTHNTWPSGSTLFTTDEKTNSWLAAYDVSNPNNITLLDKIQATPGSGSIVHNTHILDDYAITAWYRDGITITDVSRPANLVQVGNYDTYSPGSGCCFDGAWGVYPYLPSGNLLVSNIAGPGTMDGELWVLTPNYVRGCYLEGTITSAATGFPLNGAKVQLLTTNTTETTPNNGQYKMGQLQSGNFTAQVSKSGYVTQNIPVTLANGVLTTLNVALQVTPLPVELVDFTARTEGRAAWLDWQTAVEINSAGFDVQHSDDGNLWTSLGFVPARGTDTQGADYHFETSPLASGAHYFRLRQTDLDGKTELSAVRAIRIAGAGLHAELWPNLAHDASHLHLQSEQTTDARMEIFRADGQSTGVGQDILVDRETNWPLPVAQLPPGIYFVVVRMEGTRWTLPLVKE